MKKDLQLLTEAYEKVLNEDGSLEQYNRAQMEGEALKTDVVDPTSRVALAYRLLEQVFNEVSDNSLKMAYQQLQELKNSNVYTYRGLTRVPFIRDVFTIIEDEYGYRNDIRKDAEEEMGHDGSKAEPPKQPNGW